MLELRKFVAPEYVFGADARKLAPRYAENLGGQRIFLVTDRGIQSAGWVNELVRDLDEHGLEYVIFDDISPNPRDHEVMKGAALYGQENCDLILAIGGGSVMDCAKGIGIVYSNQQDILSFEGVDRVRQPMPPLICIPTTAGTSADVSQFAIINNTRERVKIAIISKSVVPDLALIDPILLTTMDPYLTACTGLDALAHAVEAFVSNASSHVTDLYALDAVRLIHASLLDSLGNPLDMESRSRLMMASLEAGLAFSNASLGCVHSMAHSLGGFLDLPHGQCNAMLLPHVVDYNYEVAATRYDLIGEALGLNFGGLNGIQRKKMLLKAFFALREAAGVSATLTQSGVSFSDIPVLAAKAINDPCNATNPRMPVEKDLQVILSEAM
jgi:alcohol dehydrogenase